MKINKATGGRSFMPKPLTIAVALALGMIGQASAFSIETDDPDTNIRWDNTFRYTLAKRTGSQDSILVNSGPIGSGSANVDDGDRNFGNGDLTANRLDIFSEFDLTYQKRFGFRVSGALWNDNVYSGTLRSDQLRSNLNHAGNDYGISSTSNRYAYRSGELLDAFAFAGFDVGDGKLDFRLGKHTIYWGESLYNIGNSIAYSQSPVDLAKALQSPGIETKETFLPRNQLSVQWAVSPEITFAAQKFLDWEAFRLPNPGTYLGFSDVLGEGAENYNFGGTLIPRTSDNRPGKNQDFGLSMRYAPSWLEGSFGVYLRQYTDMQPANVILTPGVNFIAANIAPLVGATASNYANGLYDAGLITAGKPVLTSAVQLKGAPSGIGNYAISYADKVQMLGFSLSKNIGGVSFGAELSYRQNAPLSSFPIFVINAANYAVLVNKFGQQLKYSPNTPSPEDASARGTTFHGLVNFLGTMNENSVFDTASWAVELNMVHLGSVTKHKELFKGSADWYQGIDKPTTNSYGVNVNFTPGWFRVFPSADIYVPISYSKGVKGNAPIPGTINEGLGSYAIGARIEYLTKYIFELRYAGYYGNVSYQDIGGGINGAPVIALVGNGATATLKDRNQLIFTFKTAF